MDETERLAKRKAFIDKRRHELAGLVLDGMTLNRTGAELALWARTTMHRTDKILADLFDELYPPPAKPLALTEADKAKLEAEKKRPK